MASIGRGTSQWGFTSYIILILFGALVYNSGPLDSDRPAQESYGERILTTANAVPARLWQDPFASLAKHPSTQNPQLVIAKRADLENHTVTIPQLPFEELNAAISESIIALGVMINSGPYSEIVERRKRRRFAVLSALARNNYVPEQTNFIKYFDAHNILDLSTLKEQYNLSPYIPYEWYTHTTDNKRVLVLWLQDEMFLQNPVNTVQRLTECITSYAKVYRKKNISFNFVGPATSTLLTRFYAKGDDISNISKYLFYSPTATVPESSLRQSLGRQGALPKNIRRTITTDDQLAQVLVNELHHRGLKQETVNSLPTLTDHIALISELDTVFGRAMPILFEKQLGCDRQGANNPVNNNNCAHIHSYRYLRGIDGITHEQTKDDKKPDAKEIKNRQRQPVGDSQYDYLRRLAKLIHTEHIRLKKAGEGGIRFIGVLGNDVYDKLLILQAIRPELPGVVFFTTDLDARLLQPSEYAWTRNLLIASGFGFRLDGPIQGPIPPFRDNYQTSVFHATLLATNNGSLPDGTAFNPDYLKPQLFEIGRHNAVRLQYPNLGDTAKTVFQLHPKTDNKPSLGTVVSILLILLLAIFAYHQSALKDIRFSIAKWLLAGWVIIALLTWFAWNMSSTQEPFSFFNGISLWPAFYIRACAAVLAFYLITATFSGLKENYDSLTKQYFGDVTIPYLPQKSLRYAILFLVPTLAVFGMSIKLMESNHWLIVVIIWLGLLIAFYLLMFTQKIKYITTWANDTKSNITLNVLTHWVTYGRHGMLADRVFRTFAITLLYMGFACLLFMVFGAPNLPYRGEGIFILDKFILIPTIMGMLFLLFLVVDETRLCTSWIYKFIDQKVVWDEYCQVTLHNHDPAYHTYAAEWLNIQLIASRTHAVGRLVYYPFFIIVLMLVSRSTFFDNWAFPVALMTILVLNILIAIFCATKLRHVAEKARHAALSTLNRYIIELQGEVSPPAPSTEANPSITPATPTPASPVSNKAKIDYIQRLIEEIIHIDSGIFRSFRDQPFVRATVIVLGAISLTITEYLRIQG